MRSRSAPTDPAPYVHLYPPADSGRGRKLQPSDSLRQTVDRVLHRAEAILGSAT